MKGKNYDLSIVVLILSVFILFLYFFIYLFPNNEPIFKDFTLEEIINECSNQTLIESAYCIRDITKTFYKYNMSNVRKDMNFETLKKEGGVCDSWADYWCGIGDKLGYYTKKVEIDEGFANFTINGVYREWLTGHAFCVWSDTSSYIIADGLKLTNFKFKNSFERN